MERDLAYLAATLAYVLRRRRGFVDRGDGAAAEGAAAAGGTTAAAPPPAARGSRWVDAFRPGADR